MPAVYAKCPNCGVTIEVYNTHESGVCSYCGASYLTDVALKTYFAGKFGGKNPKDNATNKEKELFIRGCSHMALGEYEKASEQFLKATSAAPENPRYWLYLLYALTEKFNSVYRIFCENSEMQVGKSKVVCRNVYQNFIKLAEASDYAEAAEEMGIDLAPDNPGLCKRVIENILGRRKIRSGIFGYEEAGYNALLKLNEVNPELAGEYRKKLCEKFCFVSDGVLEINSLLFYPDMPDGELVIKSDADSIEFRDDDMAGKERFGCFVLTPGIQSIGSAFPIGCLKVSCDVPDRLMYGCGGLTEVIFTENVRNIGTDAFNNCVSLRKAELPEGITAIGDRAFLGTWIRYARIPSSVKLLGNEVFGVKSKFENDVDISKYLFRIPHPLEKKYPDWNKVGIKRSGYILEGKEGLTLYYPENAKKDPDGNVTKIPLTEDEKRIFTANAVSRLNGEELGKKKRQGGGFFSFFKRK